jgi:hypothetical protein
LAAVYPKDYPKHFTLVVQSLAERVVGGFRASLFIVLAGVGLLLLIGCGNVALVMAAEVTFADGNHREREAAGRLHTPCCSAATAGADKDYDTAGFVDAMREQGVTPHVAQNTTKRRSAIDGRTTRHGGYGASQILRKLVEHPFGWLKSAAGLWQVKVVTATAST